MSTKYYEQVEQALEELLAEASSNPALKVTVTGLCKRSGVSRSTLHKPEYANLIARLKRGEPKSGLPKLTTGTNSEVVTKLEAELALAKEENRKLRNTLQELQQTIFALELKSPTGQC